MFSAPVHAAAQLAQRTKNGRPGARMAAAINAEAFDVVLQIVQRTSRPFDHVRTSTEWGSNPLQLAAARGNREVVEALLGVGAEVNSKNAKGQTPLWLASAVADMGIVVLLLESVSIFPSTHLVTKMRFFVYLFSDSTCPAVPSPCSSLVVAGLGQM